MGKKKGNSEIIWNRIIPFLKPYWHLELFAFIFTVISTIATVLSMWLIKYLMDDVLIAKNVKLLFSLCLSFAAISITGTVAGFARQYFFSKVGQNVVADIRFKLINHVVKLPQSFLINVKTGDIISRCMNDVANLQNIISSSLIDLITSVVTIVGVVAWLFIVDWRLACILLPVVPLFLIVLKALGPKVGNVSVKTQQKMSETTSLLQQAVSGIEIIKNFLVEHIFSRKFHNKARELADISVKQSIAMNAMNMMGWFVIYPYEIVFFVISGYWYITQGKPTIGTMFAFSNYLSLLLNPAATLMGIFSQFSQASASIKRIFEYLDHEPERDGQRELPDSVQGYVRYEGVYFSYDGQKDVLKDINLVVEAGHMVALVGPTGSGKTTLTRLLMRLYAPDRGRITIDGIDIAELTLKSLRKSIGWVPQETYLFDASIRENLLYARPDATEQEIEEACKKAQIHNFIMSLPDGYDTVIGERGIKLSGGERQRLSIARAILKDPNILVMDEPTSELDALTEAALWEAINKHFKGRTVLVVAHRLSTVRSADKIVVMEKGCIVEEGRHEELLERNGLYAKLYHKQFEKDEQIAVM
ncbi:ATP-binding cassette, subfamily B [Caldanaerobius fijiensis DSM 17918]|uniref:ATP-binding cassette, subfamily B n=1 Tax=Caldanaerobius fijiensis DSM 17918 TaxID=1121256 RepID=A0A1M5E0E1_9THEO|nr:ABC transporter ATP-binding protein [Caldanaerobius fijiensis]SHF72713.1 ATP-binding cassette, subfamily B [Caldanaerobius fijiensis DSM 17918]